MRVSMFQWELTDAVLVHGKFLQSDDDDDGGEKDFLYCCRNGTCISACFDGYQECVYRDLRKLIHLFWKRRRRSSEVRDNFSITL